MEGYAEVDDFSLMRVHFYCFLDVNALDVGMHACVFAELDQYL